jgi:hypothetical protein
LAARTSSSAANTSHSIGDRHWIERGKNRG